MTSRWISLQSRELTRWSWKLNIFTIEQYFLTKLPDYSHPWVPSQSDRCDSGGLCRGQAAAAAASVRQVPCLLFKWGLACHLHRSKPIAVPRCDKGLGEGGRDPDLTLTTEIWHTEMDKMNDFNFEVAQGDGDLIVTRVVLPLSPAGRPGSLPDITCTWRPRLISRWRLMRTRST